MSRKAPLSLLLGEPKTHLGLHPQGRFGPAAAQVRCPKTCTLCHKLLVATAVLAMHAGGGSNAS
jgi:hypothetical protein